MARTGNHCIHTKFQIGLYFNILWFIFFLSWSLILLLPFHIYAEELVSVHAGLGNLKTRASNEHFDSESKSTQRHVGLGLEFEKDRYPLRISLQGLYFTTDEESEEWASDTSGSMPQDQLDIHGVTLDALAYYMPYQFSLGGNRISLKPFLGGGLVYRRFKLQRQGFSGNMITLTGTTRYYLGDQSILAIGAMPHIGLFLKVPKSDWEACFSVGWAFLAANSNINYQISFSGSEKIRYPFQVDTSGNAMMSSITLKKGWESYFLSLRLIWEKTEIDDKSIFFYSDGTDVFLPFPEMEFTQMIGDISLSYLF